MRSDLPLQFGRAVVISAALAGAMLSAAWGWAELGVDAAWARYRETGPTPASAHLLVDRTLQAVRLNPAEPRYLAVLVQLYEDAAWRLPAASPAALDYRRRALAAAEESVRRNPASGFAWATVAELRVQIGSPVTAQAPLQRAAALGVHDAPTRQKIVWVGLAGWRFWDAGARAAVIAAVARSIGDHAQLREMIWYAVHFGWDSQLEALLRTDEQKQALAVARARVRRGR